MNVFRSARQVAVLLLVVLAPFAARADERGTPEEAQAMVARAMAAYDDMDAAVFFGIVNETPKPEFFDRDLYIFVVDETGTTVAHAASPNLVGTDVTTLLDADFKAFGSAFVTEATPEGAWVDYRWEDPETGTIEPKSSWVVRHDGYIFGCGVYRP